MFDVIIIGTGISGLYTGFKLKNKHILLIGRDIGGRSNSASFHSVNVPIGAGIGRKQKDVLLAGLMTELHIPIHEFVIHENYIGFQPLDIFSVLKKKPKKGETFREYGHRTLGDRYETFLETAGYRDYENEDAKEVIESYGMEDNVPGWTGFSVPWKTLVQKLVDKIGRQCIRKENVVSIKRRDHGFSVFTENNEYQSSSIVLATTVDTVRKLLKDPIYKGIQGQPFIRIYGKFNSDSTEILKSVNTTTLVKGPLQKIIPMKKGVFMIAYADNRNAMYLHKYSENTLENRKKLEKLLEEALQISPLKLLDVKSFFWKIGTHYYCPSHLPRSQFIYEAQHPAPNILVVGEMVATNQGWVEGALESVENGLRF